MKISDERRRQLSEHALGLDARALLRCRIAANLIHTGQYEAAREALGDLWLGIGLRPALEGLATLTTAEVLLQCGVLSGWLGSASQMPGVQEQAKDLLSEALRISNSEGQHSKASEAQYELGMCYFRLGAYDESRVILKEGAKGLEEEDTELKAKILIRLTLVEIWTGRYHDAWHVLKEAESFFENCNDALKGRWHGQMALVLRRLATAEGRADYTDRAIMEYTAAIYHYEQAKHERYCATNLNNLAFLLYMIGRYEEAHEHLDRAIKLLTRLKDSGLLAQMNETRARVLVAEHRYEEANRIISGVVETFEHGGERALLADALVIQGLSLARLGEHDRSLPLLRQAVNLAEDSGSFPNAGLAALTLIEEHGTARLSEYELHSVYRRADQLLNNTQDFEDIRRLRRCAHVVMRRLAFAKPGDQGFSLSSAVHDFEARYIDEALQFAEGSVTKAARRLGMSHQALASLLQTRHKLLESKRTPALPRRRSIIKK